MNEEEKSLSVYKKKNSKSPSKYFFEKDIFQIRFGVKSKNLIKRYNEFKTPQLKKPWLFMSFIMKDSSIDLFMKEEQILNWIFGLNEIIRKNGMTNLRVITCRGFVVKKLKLKLIQKLKENFLNQKIEEKDKEQNQSKEKSCDMKDIIIVTQIKKFLKLNQLGLDQLSFAKVLLLYLKFFEIKLDELPKD